MGLAQNSFGWSAEQFWKATPHEFWSMVDARVEANKQIKK